MLAPINIERLGREIAAAAKQAQENSPEFLHKRIAELERAGKGSENVESARELARLQAEVDRLTPLAEEAVRLRLELGEATAKNSEILTSLRALLEGISSDSLPPAWQHSTAPAPTDSSELPLQPMAKRKPVPTPVVNDSLWTSERKILDALASLEAVGVEAPSKTQLAAFAGYSNPKSGGFAAPAASLVRKGLMESVGGKASLTDAGRNAANKPGRPATSRELQERIFALLGEGERKLLTLLISTYPESLTRVELARQGGYSNAKSGGFATPLARLVELGFVEAVRPGVVRGSDLLFLKGKARAR